MSTNSSSEKRPRLSVWKNTLKNVLLSAGVFLLCVLIAEITLRFLGYGNVEIYRPDSLVYWTLRPNQTCYTKINHKPVRVNSHGTRGREFSVEKPPNTFRIVSLGDSKTFGWGLSEEETYSGLVDYSGFGRKASRRKIRTGKND